MPPQLQLGGGEFNGGFENRPLQRDEEYRVFVRAYTADDVSCYNFSLTYPDIGGPAPFWRLYR